MDDFFNKYGSITIALLTFFMFFGGYYIGSLDMNGFTIQDVCSECNHVYGMSEGYCINTYVIPSPEKVDNFCHNRGYDAGYLEGVTGTGIKCYTREGETTRSHLFTNEEINFIHEQGEHISDR